VVPLNYKLFFNTEVEEAVGSLCKDIIVRRYDIKIYLL